MRTAGIWIFGLFGSGVLAGIIGDAISPANLYGQSSGGLYGFIAGVFLFTCIRLWMGEAKKQEK